MQGVSFYPPSDGWPEFYMMHENSEHPVCYRDHMVEILENGGHLRGLAYKYVQKYCPEIVHSEMNGCGLQYQALDELSHILVKLLR